MDHTITSRAPEAPIKSLCKWIDEQHSILERSWLKPKGIGQEQAATLLGMSRMNLWRILNERPSRLALGRKMEVYLRLREWARLDDLGDEDDKSIDQPMSVDAKSRWLSISGGNRQWTAAQDQRP